MTTNDVRLVVCDVDGTLVRGNKTLPDANIAASRRLHEAGIAMSLISGRPMSGMLEIPEALGIDGPLSAFNGGTMFNREGMLGTPQRLAPERVLRVLSILDETGVDAWLFAYGRWYARDAHNPHVPRERLSSGVEPTLRSDLANLCDAVDKIVGVSDDAELLKRVESEVRDATRGDASVALSQPYFLDVTALLANKGDGMAAVASAMGVPLACVAVMGDMRNDLPMFERAGLSIAMGQAPEAVRAAADWTTGSNEEDGVSQAIDRLLGERP